MKMELRLNHALLCTLLAFNASCAKVSDAQKQDAANIIAGFSSGLGGDSAGSALTLQSNDSATLASLIHETAEGAVWSTLFRDDPANVAPGEFTTQATFQGCTSGTASSGGAICNYSCPTSSSLKFDCSSSQSMSSTCNGTTYTFSNTAFGITADITSVTGSGLSATGTMSMAFNFSANVTGGNLDGKKLACNMNFSFDIKQARVGLITLSPDCTTFSCSWDGSEISCEDLKAKFNPITNSCS